MFGVTTYHSTEPLLYFFYVTAKYSFFLEDPFCMSGIGAHTQFCVIAEIVTNLLLFIIIINKYHVYLV